ncbi:MAG: protein-glutamate O-methyltransferase CheR [Candidatus Methylomirabilales bacterium]
MAAHPPAAPEAGEHLWGYVMSRQEFAALRDLVKAHTGIALSEHKRSLVASRLGKRLRALGLTSFRDYCAYLTGEEGVAERENFVNAITTNKTDFFREPLHFEFLRSRVLPDMRAAAARTGSRRLRIWSAACSTGEEPYTIAITVREALESLAAWDVRILASDIDTQVLAQAEAGIYAAERTSGLRPDLLARHFLRGTGPRAGQVRIRPETGSLVTFRRINLLDSPWPIRTVFDCIFCRNVLIYFDKPTQRRLIGRFADYLTEDGYLFLGHSESLYGLSDRFTYLRNTIYRKASATRPAEAPGAGRPR